MNFPIKSLVAATLVICGAAHASTVTFESAASNAGAQASAAAYQSVVEQALAQPGAQSAVVPSFDNLSNQSVFGGSNANIAYLMTVDFTVGASDAGLWGLRAGVDFGNGGAVFLDGVALAFNANNMWWNGSYGDAGQSFQFSALNLAAGDHTLQLYGLENCCDGGQQAQFSIRGGQYKTFASNDGLTAAVPEPETYALMLAGLGVLGFVSRRRRA